MRNLLQRFKDLRWRQFAMIVPIAFGFSSCAICGGDVIDGKNICDDFNLISVVGFPNGPVKVNFTSPAHGLDGLTIGVYGEDGYLGNTQTLYAPGQILPTNVFMTVQLDQAMVKQVLNGNGTFHLMGTGGFADTNGVGACEFDWSIQFKKATNNKKAAPKQPTATLPPPPPPPPAQNPPSPKQPTPCPQGYYGTPGHCLKHQ
ncbi:MAG TPA: hypothetical protein VKQ72_20385 [Aggregatilineales bacterium]|nr:hypothetical protein [Aggregatilineales bacterium]